MSTPIVAVAFAVGLGVGASACALAGGASVPALESMQLGAESIL